MSEIINGPIYEGCFVRMRNGGVCGPIVSTDNERWPWVFLETSWSNSGKFTHGGTHSDHDIIEVMPNPFAASAPPKPSYEQRLWDDVAIAVYAELGVDPDTAWSRAAQTSFTAANIFMAERARRMK
jgi:hypothetical protein